MPSGFPEEKTPRASNSEGTPAVFQDVFLARQPIVDSAMNVVAYEVLFRKGTSNQANVHDGFQATSQVLLNAFVNLGLDEVVGEKLAFVNLTREFLVGEISLPMAPDRLVLEILEDIVIDAELIAGVKKLVDQGYTLALDDVTYEERLVPLLDLAKIVKVELPQIPRGRWGEHLKHFRRHDVKVLAEKVETPAEFELCRKLGFDLFQGYFLSKPQVLTGKQLASDQITVFKLLSELNQPNVNVDQLERLIKRDANLSFKLLRFINSAKYGLRRQVDSLRQAIVLLGIQGVRTLTTLVSMSQLSCQRPETLRLAMLRAMVCEKLAAQIPGTDPGACFTAGMVSMLDAVVDIPLNQLMTMLPISESVRLAVTERQGPIGEIVNCAISLDQPELPFVTCGTLTVEQVRLAYLKAIAETEALWALVE